MTCQAENLNAIVELTVILIVDGVSSAALISIQSATDAHCQKGMQISHKDTLLVVPGNLEVEIKTQN